MCDLVEACKAGDLDKVKKVCNKAIQSATYCASFYNHIHILTYLCESMHADVSDGYALKLACIRDNTEVVKYLVDRGAKVDIYVCMIAIYFCHNHLLEYLHIESML